MKLYEIFKCLQSNTLISIPSIREGLVFNADKYIPYLQHKQDDIDKEYYISRVEFYPGYDGEVFLEFSEYDSDYNQSELYSVIKDAICRCIESDDFHPQYIIKQVSRIELFFRDMNRLFSFSHQFNLSIFEGLYKFLNLCISHKINPECSNVKSLNADMELRHIFRLLITNERVFNIYSGVHQFKLSKTRLIHILTLLVTNRSNFYQSISIYYNHKLIADNITVEYLNSQTIDCYKYTNPILTLDDTLRELSSLINKPVEKMVYEPDNKKLIIDISDSKDGIYDHLLFDSTQFPADLLLGRNIKNGSQYVDSTNQLVITCDDNNTIVDVNQFIGDSYMLISAQ